MTKGYIKLHRQLLDHFYWQKKPFTKGQAWVDLLLMANHADNSFRMGSRRIHLQRSQMLTSAYKLANRWGWSEKRTRNYLHELIEEEMIQRETTRHYTIITIMNYDKWQGDAATDQDARKTHTQAENGRSENVDGAGTTQKRDARKTHTQAGTERQTRNKEIKNDKENNLEEYVEIVAETPMEPIPYRQIIDLYHSACPSFPRVVQLTENRKRQIAARWADYKQGMKPFFQLFNAAEASAFLRGENDRGWRATIDWLLKAQNMAKVLEGTYGDRKGGRNASTGQGTAEFEPYANIGIDLEEM